MNDRDALYNAVHDYPGGAEALAPRMGVAASTLQSMANPNLDSHGWSLKRFKQVQHLTNDTRPLEAVCTEFGGLFIKLKPVDGKGPAEIYEDLARLGKEFGDVPRKVMEALADGRVTAKEFVKIEREVMELQQVGAQLMHHLKTMVVKPPETKK